MFRTGAALEVCSYSQPLETVKESSGVFASQPMLADAAVNIPAVVPPSAVPDGFCPLAIHTIMWFTGQLETGAHVSTVLPPLHDGKVVRNWEVVES